LDQKEPNPDPQQALSDSIDELMDELDVSHAPVDQANDQSTNELNASDSTADSSTSDALEALDAVTENTEALIDDAIGELLNEPGPTNLDADTDQPTTDPDADVQEPSSSIDTDPLAAVADDLINGDAPVTETPTPESSAPESAPADSATDDALIDEVLEAVNEDLVEDIAAEPVPETDAVTEAGTDSIAEPTAEPDPEPAVAEVEPTTETISEATEPNESNKSDESAEEPTEQAENQEQEQEQAQETESVTEPDADTDTDTDTDPATPSEPDMGLGDLDDALAGLGDDLLMGDFATPEGELVESTTNGDDQAHSLLLESLALESTPIKSVDAPDDAPDAAEAADANPSAAPEPVADTEPDSQSNTPPAPATPELTEPTTEPAAEPAAEPKSQPAAVVEATVPAIGSPGATVAAKTGPATPAIKAPTHSPDLSGAHTDELEEDDEIRSIWQTAFLIGQKKSKQYAHLIATRGGPVLAKGILQLSRPLASKSPEVRNSVGYIAIWTLFLATILWGYTMFFRTPPTPTPTKAPTRVVTSGDDLAPIENQMPGESP